LRVLINNLELTAPSGTTVYVRDLALELKRRGHEPVVYTRAIGAVARELQDAGVLVTRNLDSIRQPPDVIHGHHWLVTLRAIRRFPSVSAIYICHDHVSCFNRAVITPQVARYFGVSKLCVVRLIGEGIAPERIGLLPNFVDIGRFVARTALPARPRRALVFSNYASNETHLPAVQEACRRAGIELDVAGLSAGKPLSRPETALGRYDLIFAKAKAAIEAMASGTAVILCDFGGVGPLVTSENFGRLRNMNFGFQSLTEPLMPSSVLKQIDRYDPEDAARVCVLVRSTASLEHAVTRLCEIYADVIAGSQHPLVATRSRRAGRETLAEATDEAKFMLSRVWCGIPPAVRTRLRRLPVLASLLARARKFYRAA
jgi:hypothetical protein